MTLALAEMPLKPLSQGASGSSGRIVHARCMFGNTYGLATARTSFNRASLVISSAFGTIFIANVNFQARKPVLKSRELLPYRRLDPLSDILRSHYRTVGIELDLHGKFSSILLSFTQRLGIDPVSLFLADWRGSSSKILLDI
tara:strand:- start:577 stop:1002 length:426 start_codon:yes stop_codon:yes gene_type:complete